MPEVEASCSVVLAQRVSNFTSSSGSLPLSVVNIKCRIMEGTCTKNTVPGPAARSKELMSKVLKLRDGRTPSFHSYCWTTEGA